MSIHEARSEYVAIWHHFGYTAGMSVILDHIRAAIRASDKTPSGIAMGAGIARSQVSRLMRNDRGLSTESVERLAEYLNLEIIIRPKQPKKKGG